MLDLMVCNTVLMDVIKADIMQLDIMLLNVMQLDIALLNIMQLDIELLLNYARGHYVIGYNVTWSSLHICNCVCLLTSVLIA